MQHRNSRRGHGTRNLLAVLLAAGIGAAANPASAQEAAAVEAVAGDEKGTPTIQRQPTAQPSSRKPSEGQAKPAGGKPGEGKPGEQKKPGEGKAEEKKKDDDKPAVTTRPEKPPTPADPDELSVRPSEDGTVSFSFRGQAWPDVLDWLADVSHMSLDWQELPADYLNLSTRQPFTVAETRDLINRHLLARGFTLLEKNGVLSAVRVEKLNPAMLPRVAPEQLDQRQPYEFVKTSFQLDWLVAEEAAKELQPMLSPNGKLTPLKGTNRLEAMDAAINLQQIAALLREEQSLDRRSDLVQEFPLKYTRASQVRQQLEQMLGIEKKSGPVVMTPQQMQQMQQQMRGRPQPNQQGQPGGAAGQANKTEVQIIANDRQNSILAYAPPDKMAVITAAIQLLDVPDSRQQSLEAYTSRMQTYRLASLDPKQLVESLQQLGALDPTTQLHVDEKNKAVIAYASLVDHVTIRAIVDKLDGSSRQFEVVQLRRLAADEVAGTIEFMMGAKEDDQSQRRSPFYIYGYRSSNQEEEKADKFRVSANLEHNQLLLWANDVELQEIRALLVKLGEIPAGERNRSTIRVLDLPPGKQRDELLERLRQAWPSLAPNVLQLPDKPDTGSEPESTEPSADAPPQDKQTARPPLRTTTYQLAQVANDGDGGGIDRVEEPAAVIVNDPSAPRRGAALDPAPPADLPATQPAAASNAPPVQITFGPDGRLVLTSDDPHALDMLEELVGQLMPRKDYHVFHLEHAPSYWVALTLEDYFKEEEEDSGRSRYPFYFYDYGRSSSSSETTRLLSNRRPLKFIADTDTNTILVQGADSSQLATIQDLIDLYDVPEPVNSQSARITNVFQIRYSKAKVVAEAVKDVYRDLLSDNDKALQQQNGQNQRNGGGVVERTYITNFGGDEGEPEQRTQVSFKGKLSIGIDEVSNTLLVSTEGQNLMENVQQLIEALDEAARPNTSVQVLTLNGGVNPEHLKKALNEVFGAKSAPQQGQGQQQGRQRGPQSRAQQQDAQQTEAEVFDDE